MHKPMVSSPLRLALLILLLPMLALAVSCHHKPPQPNLPRIFSPQATVRRTGKPPVIVIPGLFGSRLVHSRTGETLWPKLLVDDEALAMPISSINFADNKDEIVATEVLDKVNLGVLIPEIDIYSKLLASLELYGGYRRANFEAPPADGDRDTFYTFHYDWRRDLVESAQLLGRRISDLQQRLGRPDLRFDIVAYSMGGLLARYYAMYGDRDVLSKSEPDPDWSGARNLQRLVLIGTPNAGSIRALRTLLEGYSLTRTRTLPIGFLNKVIRRLPILEFSSGAAFSSPAVYQLLPPQGHARFFDARLSPLSIDLFDVETWRRFGWSVAFDEQMVEREQRRGRKNQQLKTSVAELTRRATERERFLLAALTRAAAFHRALAAASPPPPPLRFFLIGGDCASTPDAAVIITNTRAKNNTRTIFRPKDVPGGKQARAQAEELMFVPGDGSVTRRSLFAHLPEVKSEEPVPQSMRTDPVWTAFFCEIHDKLPLNLTLQDNLLTALLVNRQ